MARTELRRGDVHYTGRKLRLTENAIQFEFEMENGTKRTEWIPLSQTQSFSDTEIILTNWIAGKKDL